MRVIENTMVVEIDTWEDPGVYPSNAGGYAMRSYNFVDGHGHIVVELEENDSLSDFEDQVGDFVESIVDIPRNACIRYNIEEMDGNKIKIIPDFESAEIYF
jgi:hypothetical protein